MQYTVIIEKGENSFGAYVPDLAAWRLVKREKRCCG